MSIMPKVVISFLLCCACYSVYAIDVDAQDLNVLNMDKDMFITKEVENCINIQCTDPNNSSTNCNEDCESQANTLWQQSQ